MIFCLLQICIQSGNPFWYHKWKFCISFLKVGNISHTTFMTFWFLQDARKGVLFIDFPPVLQLQLKRFEYDFMRDTMVKVSKKWFLFSFHNIAIWSPYTWGQSYVSKKVIWSDMICSGHCLLNLVSDNSGYS